MEKTNSSGRPSATLKVVLAVGSTTFKEIVRDKILYNILMIAFLLLGLGFVASKLTFVRPERIILDFGISALSISGALVAIFTGASMVGREFERRTIFVALAHPITRMQFILGKLFGAALVQFCNWALLSLAYLAILRLVAPDTGVFTITLGWALLFLLIQTWILGAIALMFSTFSTTSLSAALTLGVYLVGSDVSQIRTVAQKMNGGFLKLGMQALANSIPDLEHFNLGTRVTYGLPIPDGMITTSLAYGVVSIAFFAILSGVLIRSRES